MKFYQITDSNTKAKVEDVMKQSAKDPVMALTWHSSNPLPPLLPEFLNLCQPLGLLIQTIETRHI